MKGDRVEIVIDAGEGARTYEVVATKAGHARASQQFIVPPGQTVVVNLTLPPEGEADATSNSAPPAVAARG